MLLVVGDETTVVETLSAFITAGQALWSSSLLHCLTWAPIQPSPGLGIHPFLFLPFSSCSLKENENLQFLVSHPSLPTFPPPLRIKPETLSMLGSCPPPPTSLSLMYLQPHPSPPCPLYSASLLAIPPPGMLFPVIGMATVIRSQVTCHPQEVLLAAQSSTAPHPKPLCQPLTQDCSC